MSSTSSTSNKIKDTDISNSVSLIHFLVRWLATQSLATVQPLHSMPANGDGVTASTSASMDISTLLTAGSALELIPLYKKQSKPSDMLDFSYIATKPQCLKCLFLNQSHIIWRGIWHTTNETIVEINVHGPPYLSHIGGRCPSRRKRCRRSRKSNNINRR